MTDIQGLPERQLIHPKRRGFLFFAAGGMAAGGLALSAWPFIHQMNPSSDVERPVEFDVSQLKPGEEVTLKIAGNPMLVRHRNPDEMEEARRVPITELRDSLARNANLAVTEMASDENRSLGESRAYVIFRPVCTRDICMVHANDLALQNPAQPGWRQCPCCGTRYDSCGRVRSPIAPHNLPIPKYSLAENGKVRFDVAGNFGT